MSTKVLGRCLALVCVAGTSLWYFNGDLSPLDSALRRATRTVFHDNTVVRTADNRRLEGVPFYIYDGHVFDAFKSCNPDEVTGDHHAAEFEFLRLIENHPWRVMDPDDAEIFVMPLPMGSVAREQCPDVNNRTVSDVVDFLTASPYYQRQQGHDHLVVSTDWRLLIRGHIWKPFWEVASNFIVGKNGIIPFHKDHALWRCTVITPFSVRPSAPEIPDLVSAENYLSSRPYNTFFQGRLYPNVGYYVRQEAATKLAGTLEPSMFITKGPGLSEIPRCDRATLRKSRDMMMDGAGPFEAQDFPSVGPCNEGKGADFDLRMSHSKLNLFFRGDDPGSARLYEGINKRTVTLVLSKFTRHLFTPFECLVDWDNLVLWGSEDAFLENPKKYLTKFVRSLKVEDYRRVLQTMERHQADVDWYHPESRVATNILYSAARKCLPGGEERKTCLFPDENLTSLKQKDAVGVIMRSNPRFDGTWNKTRNADIHSPGKVSAQATMSNNFGKVPRGKKRTDELQG